MTSNYSFHILFLTFIVGACSSKTFESSDDLLNYINKNEDYTQVAKIGVVEAKATLLPTDIMAASEASNNFTSPENIMEARARYQEFVYFRLSITQNGQNWLEQRSPNIRNYGELLQTLSFRMANYTSLITQADTLAPADAAYERGYGMMPATQLLLAFPRQELMDADNSMELHFREFGGGLGLLRFRFPVDIIHDEPVINFKKYSIHENSL